MVFEEGGVRYLTIKETLERLGGISRQALDGYVERGQLTKFVRPLKRTVLFKESEVADLLRIRPEDR